MPDSHGNATETSDLRNSPIYKEPASLLAYEPCPHPTAKQTDSLEIGTQARLIAAARAAHELGSPLTALLTIRLSEVFGVEPASAAIVALVEKIRKWCRRNDIPVHYIWVREAKGEMGEHWHFGFHLPASLQAAFAGFVGGVLGLEATSGRPRHATFGEFTRSEAGEWQLARHVEGFGGSFPGYGLASYLGKGEPSQRVFRGQLVENRRKPEKGEAFGGTLPHDRYDVPQGKIVGTAHRKKRYDISKALKAEIKQ